MLGASHGQAQRRVELAVRARDRPCTGGGRQPGDPRGQRARRHPRRDGRGSPRRLPCERRRGRARARACRRRRCGRVGARRAPRRQRHGTPPPRPPAPRANLPGPPAAARRASPRIDGSAPLGGRAGGGRRGSARSPARTPPGRGRPSIGSPTSSSPPAPAPRSSRPGGARSPTWSRATPPSRCRSCSPFRPTPTWRRASGSRADGAAGGPGLRIPSPVPTWSRRRVASWVRTPCPTRRAAAGALRSPSRQLSRKTSSGKAVRDTTGSVSWLEDEDLLQVQGSRPSEPLLRPTPLAAGGHRRRIRRGPGARRRTDHRWSPRATP